MIPFLHKPPPVPTFIQIVHSVSQSGDSKEPTAVCSTQKWISLMQT